jgi:hypothetical protein
MGAYSVYGVQCAVYGVLGRACKGLSPLHHAADAPQTLTKRQLLRQHERLQWNGKCRHYVKRFRRSGGGAWVRALALYGQLGDGTVAS